MPSLPLLDDTFLRAQWAVEFETFEAGPESAALLARLRAWAGRDVLNERASEDRSLCHGFGPGGCCSQSFRRNIPTVTEIGGKLTLRPEVADRPWRFSWFSLSAWRAFPPGSCGG